MTHPQNSAVVFPPCIQGEQGGVVPQRVALAWMIVAAALAWASSVNSRIALADEPANAAGKLSGLRAVLVSPEMVTAENINQWKNAKQQAFSSIVLELSDQDSNVRAVRNREQRTAAERIQAAGMALYYWIEIGRCPSIADENPLWMASLQGHPEWRRYHADLREPAANEVVKNYPWTPVLYREAFDAHLKRVRNLLAELPAAKGLFLNDIQGSPSACGCGNILCRWTADYGPIKTATTLGDDAPGKFVAAVKEIAPDSTIVPVWTTECEEHDTAKSGHCAGVACFQGICWKAYTRQLAALTKESPEIAALLPFRAFERDLPIYKEPAGWIRVAIESFARMPPRHQGKPIAAERIVGVLQGWDVKPAEIAAQMERCREAGAAGYIVSLIKIEQSWQPKIVQWK